MGSLRSPENRGKFKWLHVCADENALVAEEFAPENLRRLRLAAPTIFVVKAVSARPLTDFAPC